MISQRLRIFLHDITHHFLVMLAALLFLAAVALSLLHWLLPLLSEHETLVTRGLSQLIGAEVRFDRMQVGWHHLQPEIDLENVQIENRQQQMLMRIPQVDLRLGLISSLLHLKPEVSLLQIKQWQVRLYQNDQAQWQVAGVEHLPTAQPTEKKIQLDDFFSALSQIQHLKLAECHIEIQAQHQPNLVLAHTNLDWKFGSNNLTIYGNTYLQGPSSTPLQYALKLKGDLTHLTTQHFDANLYFKIGSLALAPWLTQITLPGVVWQHGTLQGEVWADWQQDHWQQAATKMQVADLNLQKQQTQKIWGFKSANTKLAASWHDKKLTFQIDSDVGNLLLGNLFRSDLPFEQMKLAGDWKKDEHGAYQLSLNNAELQALAANIHAQLKCSGSNSADAEMKLLATINLHQFDLISDYLPAGIMSPTLVRWLDRAILGGKGLQAEFLWRGPLNNFPFHDQSGTMQITSRVQGITLDYAPGWPQITDLDANLYFTAHGMHILATHGLLSGIPLNTVTADIPFQKNTAVTIHSVIDTDLNKVWPFLKESKLEKILAPLLNHVDAAGLAHILLNLKIPLGATDEPIGYHGQVVLDHDQLNLRDAPIQLTGFTGRIDFTEHTLAGSLLGQWFDTPWHITLNKKSDEQPTQIDFSGAVPLDRWVADNFNFASHWFSGRPNVKGHIDISRDAASKFAMSLVSNLKELAVHLPLGISKPVAVETPFNVTLHTLVDTTMRVDAKWLAPQGLITTVFEHNAWSIHTPVGDAQLLEPHNKEAWQINLTDLDLNHFEESLPSTLDFSKPIPAMDIQATTVHWGTWSIPSMALELRPQAHGMRIKNLLVKAKQFTISAQGSSISTYDRPVYTALQGSLTTNHLADTLVVLGFGDLLEAVSTTIHFDLSWPGALWQFDRNQLSGALNFTAGAGIFKNVSAQTNNKINLGRMLSLLSLQSLSEHLSSHFNDMTEKGFSFKGLSGKVHITPNHLNQINVPIQGTVADVLLQGCVNLEDKQLNLITQINPNVTGSLPVLAALAGGPLLGAIGFVANQFIGPVVGKLSESYYIVQGNEHDPITKKVDRIKANAALRRCALIS